MASAAPTVFMNDKVAINNDTVYRIRTMTSLVAGVAAGILGVTGLYGVIFFVVHALVVAKLIQMILCTGKNATPYFSQGAKQLFSFSELSTGMLTYILVWTLVYDSIYIF